MPRFCTNLFTLFTEVDFLERFDAAAKVGFTGVEYPFLYDVEAEAIKARLETNGLEQVLFNLPAGDWAKGERDTACYPDRAQEFREGVDKTTAYARVLDNRQVNCLVGIRLQEHDRASAEKTSIDNLRYTVGKLEAAGTHLVMEMIDTLDIPGLYLQNTCQALEIRNKVGSANLLLQYDIYHMQIMEGDLACIPENQLAVINYVQLADNPGRHEPGIDEINYRFLFEHLDRIGYQGWIGCEYKPATTTEAGLGWVKTHNVI